MYACTYVYVILLQAGIWFDFEQVHEANQGSYEEHGIMDRLSKHTPSLFEQCPESNEAGV